MVTQFIISHVERARQQLLNGRGDLALKYLVELDIYPDNLGEGKLPGARDNDIDFWKGIAYETLGNDREAARRFMLATKGNSVPGQAIFYNDPQPDKIFYQGKACEKIGDTARSRQIFEGLIRYGKEHIDDKVRIDYFAVSLPDLLVFDQDLDLKNRIHCHYVTGLGYLGLGDNILAAQHLEEVIRMNVNHQGALAHLNRTDL